MTVREPPAAISRTPGAGPSVVPRSRPVDLSHLSSQTMGDRELESEVLRLFVQQAEAARGRIVAAALDERLFLAHGLKGAASAVGAFAIAECAAEIEGHPTGRAALERLAGLIDDVRDFVAAISR